MNSFFFYEFDARVTFVLNPFTGSFEVRSLLSWAKYNKVKVTQDYVNQISDLNILRNSGYSILDFM